MRGSSRTGLIAIEEAASITAAKEAGLELLQVFVRPDSRSADLVQSVTEPVIEVAPAEYDEIFATTRKPAIVAVAARPRAPSGRALARRDGDLVVLDGVNGPGNAGSVIRAAAAFGAAGVIAVGSGVDLYRRGVIRASCGAVFHVPVAEMTVSQLVAFCERNERALVVASAHPGVGTTVVKPADPRRWALVLGGESGGASPQLVNLAASQVHIPIAPTVESLNVSAAAAILLHLRSASARPTAS